MMPDFNIDQIAWIITGCLIGCLIGLTLAIIVFAFIQA